MEILFILFMLVGVGKLLSVAAKNPKTARGFFSLFR